MRQLFLIIFAIDAADHERYVESMNELIPILQKESLKRIPLLVLFHKIDLPKAKEHLEELEIYFSPDFIQSYGAREVAYFETTIEDIKTLDAVRDNLGNHIAELTQAAGFCEDINV